MFEDILVNYKENDYVYIIEGCLDIYASRQPASNRKCAICGSYEWNIVSGFVKDLINIKNNDELNFYKINRYLPRNDKERLECILNSNNLINSIEENLETMLTIMPELKEMIGFEHKHPHHHLDVWKHTLYALSMSDNDFETRLCLLLHDIGKPYSFQEGTVRHFKGHAEKSSLISRNLLKRLGYDNEFIEKICYLIEKHDTPITEEDIINDYELEYKRYKIQCCDALAHHPKKLDKRKEYLNSIEEKFLELNNKAKYKKL